MRPLLLASQSPRRRKILTLARIPFRIVKPKGVTEKRKPGENHRVLVRRLALAKALSVAKKFPTEWVLGSDTVVVHRNRIFGKPKNRRAASRMLMSLQGDSHQVWTGVAFVGKGGKWSRTHVQKTRVFFKPITAEVLKPYLDSRTPYDKAGGYDIQGKAREWISKWEGDYFNVMGLPLRWVQKEWKRIKTREGR
jgi:septum formation protein